MNRGAELKALLNKPGRGAQLKALLGTSDDGVGIPSGQPVAPQTQERPWYDRAAVALTSRDTEQLAKDVGKAADFAVGKAEDLGKFIEGSMRSGVNAFVPGDEFSAFMNEQIGRGTYDENLKAERAISDAVPLEQQLAGIGVSALTLGRVLPMRASIPGAAAEGGTIGAVSGFSQGRGDTFEEGLQNRLMNMAGGAALGAGAGAGGAKLTQMLTRPAAPPTTEQLRKQAQSAYQAADDADILISKDAIKRLSDNVSDILYEAGAIKGLNDRSLAAYGAIADVKENLTLKGLERLRQIALKAQRTKEGDDARVAGLIVDEIDDFIINVNKSDILAGNPTQGAAMLQEARRAWAKKTKAEAIETLMDRAELKSKSLFGGSGYDNALRTEFRSLALNPKRMKRFSKDEQAAIRKVAEGGPIENVMRFFGKLAPSTPLYMTPHVGAGLATDSLVVPAAMAGFGAVSRAGAGRATGQSALQAALLARGGVSQGRKLTPLEQTLLSVGRPLVIGGPTVSQPQTNRRATP